MLMRFIVGNFLSFKETQEFSMIAGKIRKKEEHLISDENVKLLKFASIFGANASGKSNFIKAIEYSKQLIIGNKNSTKRDKYFKLNTEYKEKPSYFEYEILINKKYYSYGFEYIISKKQIISEWLIELLPNNKKDIIFERDNTNKSFKSNIKLDKKTDEIFKVYSDAILSEGDILFLTEINRKKSHLYKKNSKLNILKDILDWFDDVLDVDLPMNRVVDYSYFENNDKNHVLDIIKSFGTGISNYELVEVPFEKIKENIPEVIYNDIKNNIEDTINNDKREDKGSITLISDDQFYIINYEKSKNIKALTIEFEHNKTGEDFRFKVAEESDGTRRIIHLIQLLLTSNNKVFCIDEIDRSLHPQLTYRFIDVLLNIVKANNIQLITTTHESRLLDFGLLRQDEIWIVNKNKDGESSLYSLDEYNVRFDQKVDKAYLEGRYGGVPIFSSIFPLEEECYDED